MSIYYGQLIDLTITYTHNIGFYVLILKIDTFLPTPDFPHFYYARCKVGVAFIVAVSVMSEYDQL